MAVTQATGTLRAAAGSARRGGAERARAAAGPPRARGHGLRCGAVRCGPGRAIDGSAAVSASPRRRRRRRFLLPHLPHVRRRRRGRGARREAESSPASRLPPPRAAAGLTRGAGSSGSKAAAAAAGGRGQRVNSVRFIAPAASGAAPRGLCGAPPRRPEMTSRPAANLLEAAWPAGPALPVSPDPAPVAGGPRGHLVLRSAACARAEGAGAARPALGPAGAAPPRAGAETGTDAGQRQRQRQRGAHSPQAWVQGGRGPVPGARPDTRPPCSAFHAVRGRRGCPGRAAPRVGCSLGLVCASRTRSKVTAPPPPQARGALRGNPSGERRSS
ncbi:translation initiation factor IF-2-like [Cricetulus griseus]|uniref:Translation initiation factor IF-2-like n=1 Tax=Cricetulus griseus TaxID=10029 RepID=A0A9J7JIT7_CRIGR|nr:translation initiation factor IF-2-like [Cricetulus griseus]